MDRAAGRTLRLSSSLFLALSMSLSLRRLCLCLSHSVSVSLSLSLSLPVPVKELFVCLLVGAKPPIRYQISLMTRLYEGLYCLDLMGAVLKSLKPARRR